MLQSVRVTRGSSKISASSKVRTISAARQCLRHSNIRFSSSYSSHPGSSPCSVHRRQKRIQVVQSTLLVDHSTITSKPSKIRLERVDSPGNELTVRGILNVTAVPSSVYELLTAYDKGAEVYRDVIESKLLADKGDHKVIMQVCQWKFLAFSGTFTTQLRVIEAPQQLSVTFNLLDSALLKSFKGTWKVIPQGTNNCEVQYTLTVEPHMQMPIPIKAAVSAAFSHQAELLLRDLSLAVVKHQPSRTKQGGI